MLAVLVMAPTTRLNQSRARSEALRAAYSARKASLRARL